MAVSMSSAVRFAARALQQKQMLVLVGISRLLVTGDVLPEGSQRRWGGRCVAVRQCKPSGRYPL